MKYYGDVYRPPSEARSLIIQCTIGCSQNTCIFCPMYKEDHFHIRRQKDILEDLEEMAMYIPHTRRIFLADGDALVIPTERLLEILDTAYNLYPLLERVTAYATVGDILRKSEEELEALVAHGLSMLYIGLESGSDRILEEMGKKQKRDEYVEACLKAKRAGFLLSITLLFGLGEKENSKEHIEESAKAISASRPHFVSFLSLQLSPKAPIYQEVLKGNFTMLDDDEIMEEMSQFISLVDSPRTIFRSNHASNPKAVKGVFNEDKERMLKEIQQTMKNKDYRSKYYRGI